MRPSISTQNATDLRSPQTRQVAVQAAAALAVLSLAWPYYGLKGVALPWPTTAIAIGAVALLLSWLTRQPWWWRFIHAGFAPLAWWILTLQIPPAWFLSAFLLMAFVYRGAVGGQIPLYFSNRPTAVALATLIPDRLPVHFIDLGAGVGSALLPLAKARPSSHFSGLENAPATWLLARLRTLRVRNCDIGLGNLWQKNLSPYEFVYAFLSPAAMAGLWEKAEKEMQNGSLFISNSFAVPDVTPSEIIEVGDTRGTRLFCYRICKPS